MKILRVLAILASLSMGIINAQAIDLNINNTSARNLVETLSKQYNLSIVGTDKLKGDINIFVNDKSIEEIIRIIANDKGCNLLNYDGAYYIVDNKKDGIQEIEIIKPKFISAPELKDALSIVLPKDKIYIAKESNQVVLYGNLAERSLARKILKGIDKKVQQVKVEVYVVAVQKGERNEQGVQWEWENDKVPGHITFHKALKAPFKLSGGPQVSALNQAGNAKIIANPNIMARNGASAHILIGDRIPVLVERDEGNDSKTTVEYEEAGISLSYTPYITEEGSIDATIKAGVSTPHLVSEIKAYRITTREAKTRVNLKDGEVLVIGGLMDQRNESIKHKVPLLGDIPLLGKLFSYELEDNSKVELFILLKGTIEK